MGIPITDLYKRMQVETADPLTLILMLYDRAIVLMEKAKNDILEKKYEEKNIALNKANDIVFELMAALDRSNGGEVADSLAGLYPYVIREINNANTSLNTEALDNAKRIMSELRESWSGIKNHPDIVLNKTSSINTDIDLSG